MYITANSGIIKLYASYTVGGVYYLLTPSPLSGPVHVHYPQANSAGPREGNVPLCEQDAAYHEVKKGSKGWGFSWEGVWTSAF